MLGAVSAGTEKTDRLALRYRCLPTDFSAIRETIGRANPDITSRRAHASLQPNADAISHFPTGSVPQRSAIVRSRVASSADRARGRRLYNFIARDLDEGEVPPRSFAGRESHSIDADAEERLSSELPAPSDKSPIGEQ